MSQESIRIGILWAARLNRSRAAAPARQHPRTELAVVTSRQGKRRMPVAAMFPNLRGHVRASSSPSLRRSAVGVRSRVFRYPQRRRNERSARPSGRGVRLIDIAADFRLKDVALWEQWYKMKHVCPELVAGGRVRPAGSEPQKIREARIVANPGCYPTSCSWASCRSSRAGSSIRATSSRTRNPAFPAPAVRRSAHAAR
jgi:N-acetyl-gamma-glutamyl-phosphate reductase